MAKVRFVLVFFVAFALFGGLIRPATPALAAESSTLSGIDISWTLPWGELSTALVAEPDTDTVVLVNGSAKMAISVVDPTNDVDSQIESMFSVFMEQTDPSVLRMIDGDKSSYELGELVIANESYGYFYLADQDVDPLVQLFVAPVDQFRKFFESAQDSLTVASRTVFENVDAEGLEALLGIVSGQGSGSDEVDGSPSELFEDSSTGYTVGWSSPWSESSPEDTLGDFGLINPDYLMLVGYRALDTGGTTLYGGQAVFETMFNQALPSGRLIEHKAIGTDNLLYVAELQDGYAIFECSLIPGSSEVLVTMIQAFTPDLNAAVDSYQESVRVNGEVPLLAWSELESYF